MSSSLTPSATSPQDIIPILQVNATVEFGVECNDDDANTYMYEATANQGRPTVKRNWILRLDELMRNDDDNFNNKNNNSVIGVSKLLPLDLTWKLAQVNAEAKTIVWKGTAKKSISLNAPAAQVRTTSSLTLQRPSSERMFEVSIFVENLPNRDWTRLSKIMSVSVTNNSSAATVVDISAKYACAAMPYESPYIISHITAIVTSALRTPLKTMCSYFGHSSQSKAGDGATPLKSHDSTLEHLHTADSVNKSSAIASLTKERLDYRVVTPAAALASSTTDAVTMATTLEELNDEKDPSLAFSTSSGDNQPPAALVFRASNMVEQYQTSDTVEHGPTTNTAKLGHATDTTEHGHADGQANGMVEQGQAVMVEQGHATDTTEHGHADGQANGMVEQGQAVMIEQGQAADTTEHGQATDNSSHILSHGGSEPVTKNQDPSTASSTLMAHHAADTAPLAMADPPVPNRSPSPPASPPVTVATGRSEGKNFAAMSERAPLCAPAPTALQQQQPAADAAAAPAPAAAAAAVALRQQQQQHQPAAATHASKPKGKDFLAMVSRMQQPSPDTASASAPVRPVTQHQQQSEGRPMTRSQAAHGAQMQAAAQAAAGLQQHQLFDSSDGEEEVGGDVLDVTATGQQLTNAEPESTANQKKENAKASVPVAATEAKPTARTPAPAPASFSPPQASASAAPPQASASAAPAPAPASFSSSQATTASSMLLPSESTTDMTETIGENDNDDDVLDNGGGYDTDFDNGDEDNDVTLMESATSNNSHQHVGAAAGAMQQQQQQQQQQHQRQDMAPVLNQPGPIINNINNIAIALYYLDNVEREFKNFPGVYNECLTIIKYCMTQEVDTPSVIQRVSKLFRGYNHFILGFNIFLPNGYKISLADLQRMEVEEQAREQAASMDRNPGVVADKGGDDDNNDVKNGTTLTVTPFLNQYSPASRKKRANEPPAKPPVAQTTTKRSRIGGGGSILQLQQQQVQQDQFLQQQQQQQQQQLELLQLLQRLQRLQQLQDGGGMVSNMGNALSMQMQQQVVQKQNDVSTTNAVACLIQQQMQPEMLAVVAGGGTRIGAGGNILDHAQLQQHVQQQQLVQQQQQQSISKPPAEFTQPFSQGNGHNPLRKVTFTQDLHYILSELEQLGKEGMEIASFRPDGRSFMIYKPDEFMEFIKGTKLFRMKKYVSFERQMYNYDFQKIKDGPDKGSWYHAFFVKGQPIVSSLMEPNGVKRGQHGGKKNASTPASINNDCTSHFLEEDNEDDELETPSNNAEV